MVGNVRRFIRFRMRRLVRRDVRDVVGFDVVWRLVRVGGIDFHSKSLFGVSVSCFSISSLINGRSHSQAILTAPLAPITKASYLSLRPAA